MKSIFKSAVLVGLFVLAGVHSAMAQQPIEVAISDGALFESFNCQEYLILTDSNADNGNYEENESYETTLCWTSIEGDVAQIEILPTNPATGNVWDVDGNSSLFIYEGNSTAGILIGEFNSVTDPNGVFFTTDQSCLTFVFVSGAGSSGEGFVAEFKCLEALQPFDLEVVTTGSTEYSLQDFDGLSPSDSVITICYQDSISFQTILNFPLSDATGNGYEQTLETTNIVWDWGDGITEQGLGLDMNGHVYEPYGGFLITIIATDIMGQQEITRINVLVSPRPLFSGILLNDTLCVGDSTQLTGGILLQDTVGVDRSTGAINIYLDSTDSLTLPDVPGGQVTTYSTGINISNYADNPVITNPGDFVEICLNMEHSYLGDLEAWLTCPTGQTAALFQGYGAEGEYPGTGFGGGGTFLGGAIDNDGTPDAMGDGFDYCFSDDLATLGTMGDELAAGNTVPASTGNAMVEGTYLPEEDFLTSFMGCPVNGPWTLNITDNLGSDNGFIFSWNIEFSSDFYIDTIYYSPTIVDAYWLDNEDIVTNNDTIITVVPSNPGNNSFTFVAEDSFGCFHDTTFNVYVRPQIAIEDAIACDKVYDMFADNENDATWTVVSTPTNTAEAIITLNPNGNVANIQVNEYGIYEFNVTESDAFCGYSDNAFVDFRPDPQIDPLVSDTTLCVGSSILLDAGPQQANSGNFNVVWTRDGQVINTTDYAIEADVTGQYIVTITGVCGVATDTTNLVAIDIEFESRIVCGLQATGSVEVSPEGTGSWSANSPDISFSTINQLITQVSSQNYGEYEITYTDDRCVNDGVSHPFRFVQPPVINVLPQNPDFCVDTDVLVVTASITGSNTGEFLWTENGAATGFTNDTLVFEPLYFEPNVGYLLEATALDPFGVCPPGTGSTNFSGDWCEYHIPDVVTPNGDGLNDRFHVQYLELIPGSQIQIYDRWGKLVFESDNYGVYQEQNYASNAPSAGGWDPSDMDTGTYYYELLLPTLGKTESGYIEVLEGDAKP